MTAADLPPATPRRTPSPVVATATLADVDILPELNTRPSRSPSYDREHQAYALLTEEMARNPRNFLQRLAEIAAELCDSHSAGISLLDGDVFRWEAVAGVFAGARGGTIPRNQSPCGVCIDRDTTQLMYLPDRCFPALSAEPRFVEALLVPFRSKARPIGTVWIVSHDPSRKFDQEDERIVCALSRFASTICRALERAVETGEVVRFGAGPSAPLGNSQPTWGSGPAMCQVMTVVDRVSKSDCSVLLTGETGVGKEVVAREIHRCSHRRTRPFVKVNCAALPAELVESELFGHTQGAFTGAQAAGIGKFEFANHGTILLDEIGELPVGVQAKLLHVLQDGAFTRLGSNYRTCVDVRIIAATNRDLPSMIRAGLFREDLYYRLQVIEIYVPPLRERRDEISDLVDWFLRRYDGMCGTPSPKLSARLREALIAHRWSGNVRELENTIKRFVILRDETLVFAELRRGSAVAHANGPVPFPTANPALISQASATTSTDGCRVTNSLPQLVRAATTAIERGAIEEALNRCCWNRRKAARQLGLSYTTLRTKMRTLGVTSSLDCGPEDS